MRNMIFSLIAMVGVVGCHPYRVEIQQGNLIAEQAMHQLHLGMSKNEVSTLLGTPILINTFDPDSFLYAYTKQINGGKIIKKNLTLKFKQDKLIHIQ